MSKLIFRIGEESSPVVPSSIEEYSNSPFRDCLEDAKGVIERILTQNKVSPNTNPFEIGANVHESLVPNNIVAFLGDRGSGKTSCMKAMLRGLSGDFGWTLPNKRLAYLPIIDPSFFDSKHNILELFIGELYKEYKDIKKVWLQLPDNKKEEVRSLQRAFTDVKRALRFIKKTDDNLELEEQEELLGLSEGVNLVALMRSLIDAYLKCVDKDVLVVAVDDIDVHINEVFVMMEQVRKYLNLPNVLLLMAAKLQQLNQAICLYYHKEVLPQVGKDYKDIVVPDVIDIAERYLDKFIPSFHRIFMPSIEVVASSDLEIIGEDGHSIVTGSVEFTVLSMIYQKCGYLFYNYEDGPSLIIPRNLRELRNLISILYHMEDRGIGESTHSKNKLIFKNFFYNQWLADLPESIQKIAKTILSERNVNYLNKLTINCLYSFFRQSNPNNPEKNSSGDLSDFEKIVEVRMTEICNPDNIAPNLSIGDVIFLIDQIGQRINSRDARYLLFFISTHYSLLLYEAYDELSGNQSYLSGNYNEVSTQSAIPKLYHNRTADIPDYFKIVGNNFFILTGHKFLPPYQSRSSREVAMIDGWKLADEIKKMKEEILKDPNVYVAENWPLKWSVIEFFILTSSRRYDTRDASFSVERIDNWRSDSSFDPYFQSFLTRPKNILFEITAPFINLLSPKMAYDRYAEGLYDLILKCKGSLLNQLYNFRRNEDITKEHDLLSQVAIRNIEVLNDLQWWMEKRTQNIRPATNDIKVGTLNVIKSFYNSFDGKNHYNVITYLKRNVGDEPDSNNDSLDKSFHTITFRPMALFGKCLEQIENDEDALNLFISIYSPDYRFLKDRVYSDDEIMGILEKAGLKVVWDRINGKDTLFSESPFINPKRVETMELLEVFANFHIDESVLSDCLEFQLLRDYRQLCIGIRQNQLDNIEEERDKIKAQIETIQSKIKIFEDEEKRFSTEISSLRKEQQKIEKSITEIYKKLDNPKTTPEAIHLLHQEADKLRGMQINMQAQISQLDKEQKDNNLSKLEFKHQLADHLGDYQELSSRRDRLSATIRNEERMRYRR